MIGSNTANLFYILTMAAFILALHYLSSPRHARLGNQLGAAGMLIAVVVTLIGLSVPPTRDFRAAALSRSDVMPGPVG